MLLEIISLSNNFLITSTYKTTLNWLSILSSPDPLVIARKPRRMYSEREGPRGE